MSVFLSFFCSLRNQKGAAKPYIFEQVDAFSPSNLITSCAEKETRQRHTSCQKWGVFFVDTMPPCFCQYKMRLDRKVSCNNHFTLRLLHLER